MRSATQRSMRADSPVRTVAELAGAAAATPLGRSRTPVSAAVGRGLVPRRHAWAIPLLESRASPGAANLRHHDAVLEVLRGADFPIELAAHVYSALGSYVCGFVVTEPTAARPQHRPEHGPGDAGAALGRRISEPRSVHDRACTGRLRLRGRLRVRARPPSSTACSTGGSAQGRGEVVNACADLGSLG